MDKLFAVAGTSVLEGKCKVRFAKDMARAKVLAKNGHTDIKLVELPKQMTKAAALVHIAALPQFAGAACQAAIKADADGEAPTKVVKQAKPSKMAEAIVHAAAKTAKAKVAKAAAAPVVARTVSPAEAAVRAKNLETMREVHRKIKAMEKRSGMADERHEDEIAA